LKEISYSKNQITLELEEDIKEIMKCILFLCCYKANSSSMYCLSERPKINLQLIRRLYNLILQIWLMKR